MMRTLLAALLLALGPGSVVAADENPVVVELYTSQGCSSCPPADRLLGDLARRDDVIALALHVDYWDYIGWVDHFADPANTRRQKSYARSAGERMVYTPQMIIGGQDRVVGSHPTEVASILADHLAQTSDIDLQIERQGGSLVIEASAPRTPRRPLAVQVVRYLPEQTVDIGRGENAGRRLTYHNIVSDWDVVGEWTTGPRYRREVPLNGPMPVVVILQEQSYGPVRASAVLR